MGITARNEEQAAAMELLMDPNVDMVALLGPAGTGKTLLAVAAGLYQMAEHDTFDELLFTRATIALGEDIGFLPGGEEEKLSPWLGALYDNLEVIIQNKEESANQQLRLREMVKERVQIRAITFMRGRTFQHKYLVIDEAQNLTPKQVKALITRAGEGTKVVLMGNLAQIDSPYLSETSSGLSYVVERFKDWEHFGSLILSKGERSRLASAGNEKL
jgi:PhoH-like ATPase